MNRLAKVIFSLRHSRDCDSLWVCGNERNIYNSLLKKDFTSLSWFGAN